MKLYQGEIPTNMIQQEPEPDHDWMEVITAGALQSSDFLTAVDGWNNPKPGATDYERQQWDTNRYNPSDSPDFAESRYAGNPVLEGEIRKLQNQEQVSWQVKQWDKEWGRIEVEDAAPWYQILGPQVIGTIIGVEGLVTAATFGATSGAALLSPLRKAAVTGTAIGGSTAIRELYLQNKQQFRPWERSAMEIGGATLFSAGVGALLGKELRVKVADPISLEGISKQPGVGPVVDTAKGTAGAERLQTRAIDDIDHVDAEAIKNDPNLTPAERTVATAEKKAEDYEIVNPSFMKAAALGGILYKLGPDMRMLTSPFAEIRRRAAHITNQPLMLKGHQQGRGGSRLDVEAQIGDTRITHGIDQITKTGYNKYLDASVFDDAKLTRAGFDTQVKFSIADGNIHDNPNVRATGQELYEKIIEPMGKRLVRAGALKSDDGINPVPPLGDKLWFPRPWSRGKAMRSTPDEYADELITHRMTQINRKANDEAAKIAAEGSADEAAKLLEIKTKLDAAIAKLDGKKGDAQAKKSLRAAASKEKRKVIDEFRPAAAELRFAKTKAGDKKMRKFFYEMRENVAYGGDNMNLYSGMDIMTTTNTANKFTVGKGRTVDVATSDVNPEFFEGDTMMGLMHILRRQNRLVTVAEDPRFGSPDFSNVFDATRKEYEARVAIKRSAGESTEKLAKEYDRAVKDFRNLAKDFYGIKAAPEYEVLNNTGQYLKMHAAVSQLGSVMSSVQSEFAAPILSSGMSEYMRTLLGRLFSNREMAKLSKTMKADIAVGLDVSLVSSMMEKGTYDMGSSTALRRAHKVTDWTVDKLFMLGTWTRAMTTTGAYAVQSRIGRILLKKVPSKKDIAELAQMGIGEDIIDAVRQDVAKYRTKGPMGTIVLNLGDWADREVAERVITGITSAIDNAVVKLGTGSTPFVGKTMMGSLALQFKQFVIGTTSKWGLNSLQRISMGDPRGYSFLIMAQAMGMLSGEMKGYLYGRDEDFTWKEKMYNGFLYGGVFGIVPDIMSFGEVALTGDSMKYQGNRTAMGTMIGAWGGNIDRAYQTVGALSSFAQGEGVSKSGLRAGFGILPYNNWIITRPMMNQFKEYLHDEYGN